MKKLDKLWIVCFSLTVICLIGGYIETAFYDSDVNVNGIAINDKDELILAETSSPLIGKATLGIFKYNSDGKYMGSTGTKLHERFSVGLGVRLDNDENIYQLGGFEDFTLVKYDKNGHRLWYKKIKSITDADYYYDFQTDPLGAVYILGESIEKDSLVLTRIDRNGNLSWNRKLKYPGIEVATARIILDEDNVNIAIITENTNELVKTDFKKVIWRYPLQGGGTLFPDSDGNILIKSADGLTKISENGRTIWTKPMHNDLHGSQIASKDGFIYTLEYKMVWKPFHKKVYLRKFQEPGVLKWNKEAKFGMKMDEGVGGFGIDSKNNVYLVGSKRSLGRTSVFIRKYANNGDIEWTKHELKIDPMIIWFPLCYLSLIVFNFIRKPKHWLINSIGLITVMGLIIWQKISM